MCAVLLAALCAGSVSADVLVLKNGDRLKGQFVKKDAGVIHFRSGMLGLLQVPQAKVRNVIRPKPEPKPKPQAKKAPPKPEKKFEWRKYFSGRLGGGYTLRDSDYEQRQGASSNVRRIKREDEIFRLYGNVDFDYKNEHLKWDLNYRYMEQDDLRRIDFLELSQLYRHDVGKKWFLQEETSYHRDFQRLVDREIWQTVGIGYRFLDQPRFKLLVAIGPAYQNLEQEDVGSTERMLFAVDQNLDWRTEKNQLRFFEQLEVRANSDRRLITARAGVDNRMVQNLFLRLEYRYDYDSIVNLEDPFLRKMLITSVNYRF
ncbi:DUF481 domain-containing protein [Kiritimatiella glycovorans]|uniref:DUF481 domain-containing protein n=1 Tax=Kiritimatiella glycovorans TaxID=1307763 RepID=UPI000699F12D|nr:DUF481 domain-containing protein [Kiritimatiella glycovorans]